MSPEEIQAIRNKYANLPATEQNYHLLCACAGQYLRAGQSIEQTMLHLRVFAKDALPAGEYEESMNHIFYRLNKNETGGLRGPQLLNKYFDAFQDNRNGEQALKDLSIRSPKQEVTDANVQAAVRFFGMFQCMRLNKKMRVRYLINDNLVSLIMLFICIVFIAAASLLTGSLTEAGGVRNFAGICMIFGILTTWIVIRRLFRFYWRIKKYTR